MKVLVTGSAGFIGSHLYDSKNRLYKYLSLQNEMIGFDIKDSPEYDITNPKAVEAFWAENKPDVVVHLAANPKTDLSQKYPVWDVRQNIEGTINVLQASLKNRVKQFIFSSTCLVYDVHSRIPMLEQAPCNPRNPYAISKYAGEFYCKNFQERRLNTCVLRFFNVYGPGQPEGYVVPDLIKRVLTSEDGVKVLGPQDDSRDFIYVDDVAEAINRAIEKQVTGETINIGTGVETPIWVLCDTIDRVTNRGVLFNYAERPAGRLPGRYQADISKAKRLLDWEPETVLEEGIRLTRREMFP